MFLDPAVLKRKRQKYGGESSPQNILRQPQDDDSSEYFQISVKGLINLGARAYDLFLSGSRNA